MSGWLKIQRKIVKWEWYKDANTYRLFTHLLYTANFEEKKWQGVTVGRGQLITSLPHLAEALAISTQSVRTSITKLKSTGELTDKATNKYRILTIVNYEEYQSGNDDATDNATDNATGEQQASNRQATATKELKNLRTKEKNRHELPSEIPLQDWNDWIEMRKKIKKPPTEKALALAVKKLQELKISGNDPAKVLQQSTLNNWTGLFQLKREFNKPLPPPKPKTKWEDWANHGK